MEPIIAIIVGLVLGLIIGIPVGRKSQKDKCNCNGNGTIGDVNDDPSNELGVQ